MRTIKFRAWNKSRKEMYNVHGWHSEFVFKDTLDGIGTEGNPDRVEDVEIMQFTGLHDKNGREIFEGDVLRVDRLDQIFGSLSIHSVAYVDQSAKYHLMGTSFPTLIEAISNISGKNCAEVIGNIHENPELL